MGVGTFYYYVVWYVYSYVFFPFHSLCTLDARSFIFAQNNCARAIYHVVRLVFFTSSPSFLCALHSTSSFYDTIVHKDVDYVYRVYLYRIIYAYFRLVCKRQSFSGENE